jgi:hypothetical protein
VSCVLGVVAACTKQQSNVVAPVYSQCVAGPEKVHGNAKIFIKNVPLEALKSLRDHVRSDPSRNQVKWRQRASDLDSLEVCVLIRSDRKDITYENVQRYLPERLRLEGRDSDAAPQYQTLNSKLKRILSPSAFEEAGVRLSQKQRDEKSDSYPGFQGRPQPTWTLDQETSHKIVSKAKPSEDRCSHEPN